MTRKRLTSQRANSEFLQLNTSKLCKNQKWEYCCDLVAMMKKELGKDPLYSEICIEDDELFFKSTIKNNGNLYHIKVSK
jgi:hypothetical protein